MLIAKHLNTNLISVTRTFEELVYIYIHVADFLGIYCKVLPRQFQRQNSYHIVMNPWTFPYSYESSNISIEFMNPWDISI